VADYIRYRPTYPVELIDDLRNAGVLAMDRPVADIGSGTGIFARLLLERGYNVFAVEPNKPMRQAAEETLGDREGFHSIDGDAVRTGLADRGVGAIVAAQAFHWFDPEPTRAEWKRILKPGGHVVLIWNDRRTDSTPFLRGYEQLLQDFATDYNRVNHTRIDLPAMARFFGHDDIATRVYDNAQRFDYEGLVGRLLSSSYAPEAGHANHAPMMERLRAIFSEHEDNGRVVFEYDTRVYVTQFAGDPA
jgi:SAM-dependent methyltransferase